MITTNYGQDGGPLLGSSAKAPILAAQQRTVLSSHERCQVFGLLPQQRADMTCIAQAGLSELLQRNGRLCAQALPVMEMLCEQLAHAQSMVLLTDASGVILHTLGDPGFLERAQRVALMPGAVWSEAIKGTNAVGTALMTEAPTLVNGQDHYLREFHFLTCSAAPIFDHRGTLLGVINVSGDRRSYHPHTLALATLAARTIETQCFNDLFRQSLRLHLHPSAVGLGTLREGVLALDGAGQVIGANRSAMAMLGQTAGQLRRSALPSLFGIELTDLLNHTQANSEQPLQLALSNTSNQGTGVGDLLVAAHLEAGGEAPRRCLQGLLSLGSKAAASASAAQPMVPASAPVTAPATLPTAAKVTVTESGDRSAAGLTNSNEATTLRQTELQAIQAAVLSCRGNLAHAARQLGIGRSTLYRKLKDLPPQAAA